MMRWFGVTGFALVLVLALCACTARPAPAPTPSGPLAREEPLRPVAQSRSTPATAADAGPRLSLLRRTGAPDAAPASQPAFHVPSTGAKSCDEYIQRYMICVQDKIPPNARTMMQKTLMTMGDAWRKAAASPAGRKGLALACKAAMQTAKKSMKAFGCQW